MDEREATARLITELGDGNAWSGHLLQHLVSLGEYDILNHLYKKGPKGADLWMLYWRDCYQDWDLFLTDLKLRLEFDQ